MEKSLLDGVRMEDGNIVKSWSSLEWWRHVNSVCFGPHFKRKEQSFKAQTILHIQYKFYFQAIYNLTKHIHNYQ